MWSVGSLEMWVLTDIQTPNVTAPPNTQHQQAWEQTRAAAVKG
jgi:hypothetical protein